MVTLNESLIIQTMQEYEGFSLEEAQLSYKQREKLPDSAFCGPNRSYPAHDAAHVRNGLARLSQFGKGKKSYSRILACLRARAKKMGIEVSESEEDVKLQILDWFMDNYTEKCKECATK
jgi:hypothetical protein